MQATPGLGNSYIRRILEHFSHTNEDLLDFIERHFKETKRLDLLEKFISAKSTALRWYDLINKSNYTLVSINSKLYPERLKRVLGTDAPPILYFWGNLHLLHQPSIGFCGSRKVSTKGLSVAEDTSYQIALKNWVVVSGHAKGVDTATHQTALFNKGKTIIVSPEGVLCFKIRSDIKYLIDLDNTLIVSEFQPNSAWSVSNAMTRNHTICGLSDALIVIQSGLEGGTFQAGKYALNKRVPLFVADYEDAVHHDAPGNSYFLKNGASRIGKSVETQKANLNHLIREVEIHHGLISKPEKGERYIQDKLFADLPF